jgi:hypothetical protein
MKNKHLPRCLIPKCGRAQKSRGLCAACNSAALRKISRGETSWADLIDMGLALPPEKRGPRGGAFSQALKQTET